MDNLKIMQDDGTWATFVLVDPGVTHGCQGCVRLRHDNTEMRQWISREHFRYAANLRGQDPPEPPECSKLDPQKTPPAPLAKMHDTTNDAEPVPDEQVSESPTDGSWGPMSEARLLAYEEGGTHDWLCKEIRWQRAEAERLSKGNGDTTNDAGPVCHRRLDAPGEAEACAALDAAEKSIELLQSHNADMRQWIEKAVEREASRKVGERGPEPPECMRPALSKQPTERKSRIRNAINLWRSGDWRETGYRQEGGTEMGFVDFQLERLYAEPLTHIEKHRMESADPPKAPPTPRPRPKKKRPTKFKTYEVRLMFIDDLVCNSGHRGASLAGYVSKQLKARGEVELSWRKHDAVSSGRVLDIGTERVMVRHQEGTLEVPSECMRPEPTKAPPTQADKEYREQRIRDAYLDWKKGDRLYVGRTRYVNEHLKTSGLAPVTDQESRDFLES